MRITTIVLAIALTLPSTFALARGGMSMGSHVTRPFSTVGAAGRIATRPRNVSGSTLLPIAHDPSGNPDPPWNQAPENLFVRTGTAWWLLSR